jgi:hypothetical protein
LNPFAALLQVANTPTIVYANKTDQDLSMMAAMAVISEIEFMELGMSLAAPPQVEKSPGKEKCPGLRHLLWRMS